MVEARVSMSRWREMRVQYLSPLSSQQGQSETNVACTLFTKERPSSSTSFGAKVMAINAFFAMDYLLLLNTISDISRQETE